MSATASRRTAAATRGRALARIPLAPPRASRAGPHERRAAAPLQPPDLLPQFGVEGPGSLMARRCWSWGPAGSARPCPGTWRGSVGRLIVADHDEVDLSNLQRQILHRDGPHRHAEGGIRPRTCRRSTPRWRSCRSAARWRATCCASRWRRATAVVDGSDNFATRFAVNAACVAAGRPLIAGA